MSMLSATTSRTIQSVSPLTAAHDYAEAGLSFLPIRPDGSKAPDGDRLPFYLQAGPEPTWRRGWAPLQQRVPTPAEYESWWRASDDPLNGIAVICGAVSKNLEAIDFDSEDLGQPWLEAVEAAAPELIGKLVMVKTPRPGRHVYYRCPRIEKNQTLARMTFDDDGVTRTVPLIETRGEGGYALVPPSPAECHPTGRCYEYVGSRTLSDVTMITEAERALLFEISRSFDKSPPRTSRSLGASTKSPATGQRPGDIFNSTADWTELLSRYGWTCVGPVSDGVSYWCRPGKTDGTSATLNYEQSGRLYVFSSNAIPLEQGQSYSKFEFLAEMEYDGDFTAAAVALSDAGFASPTRFGHQRRSSQPGGRPYYLDRGAAYRVRNHRR